MAIPSLPDDFKEFLKLLDSNTVEYLLLGGYGERLRDVRTTSDTTIGSGLDRKSKLRAKRRPANMST
jgi:hypothetical protein